MGIMPTTCHASATVPEFRTARAGNLRIARVSMKKLLEERTRSTSELPLLTRDICVFSSRDILERGTADACQPVFGTSCCEYR
jgi:hypothetical protein